MCLKNKLWGLKLKIDVTSINRANTSNYLVITIYKHLNWRDQVNSIANKIYKYIGILNRLKYIYR